MTEKTIKIIGTEAAIVFHDDCTIAFEICEDNLVDEEAPINIDIALTTFYLLRTGNIDFINFMRMERAKMIKKMNKDYEEKPIIIN